MVQEGGALSIGLNHKNRFILNRAESDGPTKPIGTKSNTWVKKGSRHPSTSGLSSCNILPSSSAKLNGNKMLSACSYIEQQSFESMDAKHMQNAWYPVRGYLQEKDNLLNSPGLYSLAAWTGIGIMQTISLLFQIKAKSVSSKQDPADQGPQLRVLHGRCCATLEALKMPSRPHSTCFAAVPNKA
ncbi:hypothetical protein SADUNF_Sadunf01G0030500 [Salix dunnii]|uniref:Uncharacterized protein n=1 Tax=Salix dunnii TaxID=1413687 RepID=A0A835TL02_9ROSI|nr:hypothetical protein SADUNF_Sadunf01G0030500 [Salix dunnii]